MVLLGEVYSPKDFETTSSVCSYYRMYVAKSVRMTARSTGDVCTRGQAEIGDLELRSGGAGEGNRRGSRGQVG